MHNTCRTCKHWKQGEDYLSEYNEGICALAATRWAISAQPTLARAQDFEGYGADLITSGEYGCNQHAPQKEA